MGDSRQIVPLEFQASPTLSAVSSELAINVRWMTLTALSNGSINSWYATAIRGLVAKPLRDRFCSEFGGYANASGDRTSNGYCEGCTKNARCEYGRNFEPDLQVKAPESIRYGARQGLRGITFASPVVGGSRQQLAVQAGSQLRLRLLTLADSSLVDTVTDAIDFYGGTRGLWGQPPLFFRIDSDLTIDQRHTLESRTLPVTLCAGQLPVVRLNLSTPLSLKRKDNQDWQTTSSRRFARATSPLPTFRELIGHSVRTVSRAVVEYVDPEFLANTSLHDFFSPASDVELEHHDLKYFEQQRASRRRGESHLQSGWLGTIAFQNVPTAYLPWLYWAGVLGIGDSRNCGAGLWKVELT